MKVRRDLLWLVDYSISGEVFVYHHKFEKKFQNLDDALEFVRKTTRKPYKIIPTKQKVLLIYKEEVK